MNYYELKFTYESPIEATIISDVLASELGEIGFESFTEDEDGLLAYVSDQLYNVKALQDKLNEFPLENVTIRYTEQLVKARTGTKNGKKTISSPSVSVTTASSALLSTNRNRVIHIIL